MRILLDTNILARAAAGPPGLANELVLAATHRDHILLLSPFLVSELSRVLRYERLRPIHGLDDAAINQYILDLVAVAEMVIPDEAAKATAHVTTDPDDDPVVATALSGNAELLCTKDRHLLHPDVVAFCKRHKIRLIDDVDLLDLLRGTS